MNKAEVCEETWRSSGSVGPRVGEYTGDCVPC